MYIWKGMKLSIPIVGSREPEEPFLHGDVGLDFPVSLFIPETPSVEFVDVRVRFVHLFFVTVGFFLRTKKKYIPFQLVELY